VDTILYESGNILITVNTILNLKLIVIGIVVFRFVTHKFLNRYLSKRVVDPGRRLAINQIVKYITYVSAILLIINALGIGLTGLLVGSAGLLVGIGFGLQQTFNDLLSGIIILVEGSIEVGDDLVIDGLVSRVKNIGLRSSEVETRDNVAIIIPNSKLISESVSNWSHNSDPARFYVDVHVPYSTDIDLVENLIVECAINHTNVLQTPEPYVFLLNFGESSLDFRLYYFSNEFFISEKIKSDIRKDIFSKLLKENIHIPYPKRDIRIIGGK
jgi:small-conductance mechanosensitive channel